MLGEFPSTLTEKVKYISTVLTKNVGLVRI